LKKLVRLGLVFQRISLVGDFRKKTLTAYMLYIIAMGNHHLEVYMCQINMHERIISCVSNSQVMTKFQVTASRCLENDLLQMTMPLVAYSMKFSPEQDYSYTLIRQLTGNVCIYLYVVHVRTTKTFS